MHPSDLRHRSAPRLLAGALLVAALGLCPSGADADPKLQPTKAPTADASPKPTKLTITEITYRPTDTGWMWVELYNGSNQTVDLSGYVLDAGGGDTPFSAANLKGKLAPGKLAIVYDFESLGAAACTGSAAFTPAGEAACAALFRQAWPQVGSDVLLVPFFVQGRLGNFPNLWNGPPPQSWAKVVSLWASLADYLHDTSPADLRRKPAHAVCSVATPLQKNIPDWKRLTQVHVDPRNPSSTYGGISTMPTLYLSKPAGDPMDEGSWSWSEEGKGSAYRSSPTGSSPFSQNSGLDVGSPGQLP